MIEDPALQQLLDEAGDAIKAAKERSALEAARVKYLGKKGPLTAHFARLGKLPSEERRRLGDQLNSVKVEIEKLLALRSQELLEAELRGELEKPKLDVTLPGRTQRRGHRHPVSAALDDIVEIFARLGFHAANGPEIEWDLYNFEKLAIPADHPARDMQDTFYLEMKSAPEPPPGSPPTQGALKDLLLRTHTSPVQIRTMLGQEPPVRIIAPGKVYRRDSDLTHTPMFHQVECLHVERGISMAHLRGTLDAFMKAFFGSGTRTRLRPSYFPFTEPSAEVDISCLLCGGAGCRVCKGTGWKELLGAGMVNPDVLTECGYDPEEVSGYAFGVGIDRLAMFRHRVDDLRLLFENDVRFLEQL